MKFHVKKEEIIHPPILNEKETLENIFFKIDKENNQIKRKLSISSKYRNLNEHEVINILSLSLHFQQFDLLLFYHWYERKYKINIIQGNNYIINNPNIIKGLIPEVRIRKIDLHEQVRIKYINENLSSSKWDGFSIFYEYFYDFFPGIENFSFEELKGIEFIKYLIDLFPQIMWINHPNKAYSRFENKNMPKIEKRFGYNFIEYKSIGVPSFYPKTNSEEHYHWTSLAKKDIKEIENEIRNEMNLPLIGEGWISETMLYYKLKEGFSGIDIIHHGKPKWLGAQHVDIWLPNHNIGIEHQGQQHDRPIEFFGGEKSFEEGKKRDERKRMLFKKNNAFLIEVREGFNFDILCDEIKSYM
jgi:hypothetical protein